MIIYILKSRQIKTWLMFICLFSFIAFILPFGGEIHHKETNNKSLILAKIKKIDIKDVYPVNFTGESVCVLKHIGNDLLLMVSCKFEDTADYERISELVFQTFAFSSNITYDSFSIKVPRDITFYAIQDFIYKNGIENSYLLASEGLIKLSLDLENKKAQIVSHHKYPIFESIKMTTSGNLSRYNTRLHFGNKASFVDNKLIRIIQRASNEYSDYNNKQKTAPIGWFDFNIDSGTYSHVKPIIVEGISFLSSNRREFVNFIFDKLIYSDGYSSNIFLLNTVTDRVDTFELSCIKNHKDWNPIEKDSLLYLNGLSNIYQKELSSKLKGKWKYTKSRIREFYMVGEDKDSTFGIIWEVGHLNIKHWRKRETEEPINNCYLTIIKYQNSSIKVLKENIPFPMTFNVSSISASNHSIFESAIFEAIPNKGCVYYQSMCQMDSFSFYVLKNPNIISRKELFNKSKQWTKSGKYEKALFFYKYDFDK